MSKNKIGGPLWNVFDKINLENKEICNNMKTSEKVASFGFDKIHLRNVS